MITTTSFDDSSISIVGNLSGDILFEFGLGESSYQLTSRYLTKSGYDVVIKSECLAYIKSQELTYKVTCPLHRRYFKQPLEKKSIKLDVNPFQASNSEQRGSDGERTRVSG